MLLVILGGCAEPGVEQSLVEISGRTMGTYYALKIRTERQVNVEALGGEVTQMLENLNQIFSTYEPSAEISRLNAAKSTDEQQISTRLWMMLALAKAFCQKSAGAFDVTLSPLVELWGFGSAERESIAEIERRLASVRAKTGDALFSLPRRGIVVKSDKDVTLDLSAIAKGYAVDVLAQYLLAQGYEDYLVDIGGEIRAQGSNSRGKGWMVGIEKPVVGERRVGWRLPLQNQAMASSGDYRNYFEHAGKRYSHLIDPRDGYPIQIRDMTVTVVAEQASIADGWATAMAVLGVERGLPLAEKEQLAVQFAFLDKTVRSTAFQRLMAAVDDRQSD